jgi:LysM repeat protein
MTDDANDRQPQPRRRHHAPDEPAPPAGAPRGQRASVPPASQPAADDDPMAALARLESLSSSTVAAPVAEAASGARRPIKPATRVSRPRPAAGPRTGRTVARIAAPAAFLVAVVILLSILVQSGVVGGNAEPVATPTPAATKTKSGGKATPSTYKVYVVKTGDTLSGIAVRFGVSTSEIEALNPKISSSTLVVGAKVKVPKPVP